MRPIIKWPGGKQQFLPVITTMLPSHFNCYYEPFFGGGAVFFSLQYQPEKAVINDKNEELMNLYKQVRDRPEDFMLIAKEYEEEYNEMQSKEQRHDLYYKYKNEYNSLQNRSRDSKEDLQEAALFLFLNKTCWNGIYRTNRSGLFNMPVGSKNPVTLFSDVNIREVSSRLSERTVMMSGDFETCLATAGEGDFVFIDSPYYGTFDAYQAGGFPLEDHLRLFRVVTELTDRGAYCLLTNSNTKPIRELYAGYNQQVIVARQTVDTKPREEIIITNYNPTVRPSQNTKAAVLNFIQAAKEK